MKMKDSRIHREANYIESEVIDNLIEIYADDGGGQMTLIILNKKDALAFANDLVTLAENLTD